MVKKTSTPPSEDLPSKQVLEELRFLRQTLREILNHYTAVLEGDIAQITAAVSNVGSERKAAPTRAKDLRDLVMLIRSLEVKPDKGRRRDLKRIENLLVELKEIVTRW